MEDIYIYEDFEDEWAVQLDSIFTDIDGELTFSYELADSSVFQVGLNDGLLQLFSIPDSSGISELILTASNPTRATVSDTVQVTVFAVNDAPVLFAPDSIVMDEDQTFELMSMSELVEEGILADVDNGLDELSFELYTDNEQIHVEWDGNVASNPLLVTDPDYYGTGLLTLCVDDGDNHVCGENSVTITPVNDAPFLLDGCMRPLD